ncbi:MAG: phenylalanyl-tRNA synthetase, beta subunit [Pseudonocardiales bacterium]|nr:phenylalanyl-tRNA synthetase, beta subunit [Pseudonocardiales bacterium]
MRAPVSWLAEFVDLPPELSARELGDALVRVGLEIEKVESGSDDVSGPIVVGRVVAFDDEPQKNGKTIRWCQVDVGQPSPRGIVCGAHNFAVGDLVVVALPGAVLPGGFAIGARTTYGHVSDGMICSTRELGIGEDHSGILVLPPDSAGPGADALDVLGLREAVLDMAVTPDRGYCLSMRGLAREASAALGLPFHDLQPELPPVDGRAYAVSVDDPQGCDLFSARAVTGLDPAAGTPAWMAARLRLSGMRPISLAVDVANYVMLETGQPLHTFDRAKLSGPIGVRRAQPGEKLTTLDDVVRVLDPDDLVVTDDSGPIALAGVMGGASTDVDATTTDIVLEAAHWHPASIARAVRRHKLPSEAAKRFERGVDPAIAGVALQRCVDLMVQHGGAAAVDGYTVVGAAPERPLIALHADRPGAIAGLPIGRDAVVRRLVEVGCQVDGAEVLQVRPPTWRPDLTDPADLVEEVVRLEGYELIPSTLPTPPPGRGLTESQRLRRTISRALASAGFTEVLSYPFVSPSVHDAFGLAPDDPRRRACRLANPLSDAEPELRTSLLPGLLATLHRNVGRGNRDLALFETGLIFLPKPDAPPMPRPSVDQRPSDEEIAALDAGLPDQPRHVAVVLCGDVELPGWWGPGRRADWSDAVAAARTVAEAARAELDVEAADTEPWHPGRCAALILDGQVIGHAGELHPRVIAALGLPERTAAMELNLDAIAPPPPALAPALSTYPPVLLDVALVVAADTASAHVLAALREGAGELLESVRLFDLYTDEQRLGPGLKSLAFALRFRAPDRTLTVEEASAARDSAVALAAARVGARLRT